ncbi:MAG: hypothetical protein AAGA91_14225 [Pseudomonadota bacterium]
MGTVLEFPSKRAQGLAFLDDQMRLLLQRKGADDQLIDFALTQLKQIYERVHDAEQYSFSVTLPDGLSEQQRDSLAQQINGGLENIRRENHSLTLELLAELVLAQVTLFQLQRTD